MKIAIPSNDGVNLSAHFGRCREFLIFEAGEGNARLVEKRANGGCHEHGGGNQGHAGFVAALRGCDAVLCGGIGAGAVAALQGGGIRVVMVQAEGSAEALAGAYVSGTLQPSAGSMCQCQH